MKHLILIFCIGLQLLLFNSAQAWSPMDFYRSFSGVADQCQLVVAASDESEGAEKKQKSGEEEEPDCD